ncbi:MAG: hypothetical protein O3A92_11880 [Verrucomicrobia bacterium]|nr:hypothetical protein [Verrucomicrobiota bacterium]
MQNMIHIAVVHRRNGSFRDVNSDESIERRSLSTADAQNFLRKPVIWGISASGALTSLAVYLMLHPPQQIRRYLH